MWGCTVWGCTVWGIAVETSLTRADHDGPVGERHRTVELVAGKDHGSTLAGGTPHDAVEEVSARCVKARVRFVEQPQRSIASQQNRERRPASLACRQTRHHNASTSPLQAHPSECGITRRARATGSPDPEGHVVGNAQVLVQARRVAEESHERTHGSPVGSKIVTQHEGLPLDDGDETGQCSQQGGLARPVRSAKKHHLTRDDIEIDSGESGKAVKEADRGTEVDNGLHGCLPKIPVFRRSTKAGRGALGIDRRIRAQE